MLCSTRLAEGEALFNFACGLKEEWLKVLAFRRGSPPAINFRMRQL